MSAPVTRCRGCRDLVSLVDLIDATASERRPALDAPFPRWYCWRCYERIGVARVALDERGALGAAETAAGSAIALDAVLARRGARAWEVSQARARVALAVSRAIPMASAAEVAEIIGCSRDTVRAALEAAAS